MLNLGVSTAMEAETLLEFCEEAELEVENCDNDDVKNHFADLPPDFLQAVNDICVSLSGAQLVENTFRPNAAREPVLAKKPNPLRNPRELI